MNEELKKRARRLLNEKKLLDGKRKEFYVEWGKKTQAYQEELNLFLRDVALEEERG